MIYQFACCSNLKNFRLIRSNKYGSRGRCEALISLPSPLKARGRGRPRGTRSTRSRTTRPPSSRGRSEARQMIPSSPVRSRGRGRPRGVTLRTSGQTISHSQGSGSCSSRGRPRGRPRGGEETQQHRKKGQLMIQIQTRAEVHNMLLNNLALLQIIIRIIRFI